MITSKGLQIHGLESLISKRDQQIATNEASIVELQSDVDQSRTEHLSTPSTQQENILEIVKTFLALGERFALEKVFPTRGHPKK